jgi:transposase
MCSTTRHSNRIRWCGRPSRRRTAPYSPGVNPIEKVFANVKAHLRGTGARSADTLITVIDLGSDQITAHDLAGCCRHCGYALPTSA